MNAVIIEDEYLAASELERLLGEVAPDVAILAKLDSVSESVKWLRKNKVDVIFMDIHLGDGQSFDIFEQVEITVPVIIFSGESKGHHSTMGEYYKSQITTYCEHHVFRKGGHMLFFIEYEEFNEILESFIKRCNDSVTKIS